MLALVFVSIRCNILRNSWPCFKLQPSCEFSTYHSTCSSKNVRAGKIVHMALASSCAQNISMEMRELLVLTRTANLVYMRKYNSLHMCLVTVPFHSVASTGLALRVKARARAT